MIRGGKFTSLFVGWGAVGLALAALPALGCKASSRASSAKSRAVPRLSGSGNVPLVAMVVAGDSPKLAPTSLQTSVYERPDHQAKKLGVLRLGELLARTEQPVGGDACAGGWYGIAPKGFVCAGEDATLDLNHKVVRALGVKPDLSKPMPYTYAFVRAQTALYHQLPTVQDQEHFEFGLRSFRTSYERRQRHWNHVERAGANHVPLDAQGNATLPPQQEPPPPPEPDPGNLFGILDDGKTPWWLQGKRQIPNLSTFKTLHSSIYSGKVMRHAGLAVIGSFRAEKEAGGRTFAVLLDGRLVGEDKLKPHYASPFHGVALGAGVAFPFAMVKRPGASAYAPAGAGGGDWAKGSPVTYRSIVPLTGKTRLLPTSKYYETQDGRWLRNDEVAVFDRYNEPPRSFDPKSTKWIDVSIWQQTLVMYEGETPVYATMVSTGVDGMGDHETTKSTIRGEFHIDVKHVTATMDADDPESSFELRDVPWVQYFEQGYALHAAYWHDDFGKPRSHGCINLAPIDARRLFFWTEPALPQGWHAVRAGATMGVGTWVRVRG